MTLAFDSHAGVPRPPDRGSAPPDVARSAKHRLEQIVETGRARAASTVQQVLASTPDDTLVRADKLAVTSDGNAIRLQSADMSWAVHQNAFGQLCDRAGMPIVFARELHQPDVLERGAIAVDNAWRRELLTRNFHDLLCHGPARHLVRSVKGEARGVLSDKYRRLDGRPLLDAFIGACGGIDAVPYEGVATELSSSVRAIVPSVFEPVPGEFVVFGLSWQNSDFGTRAYALSAFTLRLVCLNGMVGASELKQVHLGGRLPDDMAFSERTYELDTRTLVSATTDVVKAALSPRALERKLAVIRRAHAQEVDWASAWRRVSRDLNKAEQKALKDAFEGPDVINLPAGQTTWRLSNAISWMATQHIEDGERKLDLERLAGALLPEAK